MRTFLFLWLAPMGFLGSWYFLSLNDISFGTVFFSRELHDLVFTIYGNILGMEPEAIPPLLARALVVDTLLVLAFIAFRRRKAIAAHIRERRARSAAGTAQGGETV